MTATISPRPAYQGNRGQGIDPAQVRLLERQTTDEIQAQHPDWSISKAIRASKAVVRDRINKLIALGHPDPVGELASTRATRKDPEGTAARNKASAREKRTA